MKEIRLIIPAGFFVLLALAGLTLRESPYSEISMPTTKETTSLWWRDGFPGLIDDAPWQQCLETGEYGLVFDSETVTFPNLGPLREGQSLAALSPADLELLLEVDGKSYRHTKG